jgi:hypothetical protein
MTGSYLLQAGPIFGALNYFIHIRLIVNTGVGPEHEMIHQQLGAASEQVGKRRLACSVPKR